MNDDAVKRPVLVLVPRSPRRAEPNGPSPRAELTLATEQPTKTPEPTADTWYETGCDLEQTNPEQARDAYRRALELDPHHPDAHVNLGRLLHEAGHLVAAREHYRAALTARPRDATAAFNLGVCFQDLNRPLDAVRAYLRSLDLDPAQPDAHYNLAQIYQAQGKWARAGHHEQEAERLQHASP